MKHALLTMCLALSFLAAVHAQKGKTFFQTFDIEEINSFELHIPGDFVVKTWVNQTSVLVETNVSLTQVSDMVYKHHMASGRYDLTELDDEGDRLIIGAKQKERSIIDGVETVYVTVFVPETFELTNDNTFVRKEVEKELPSDKEDKTKD